MRHCLFSISYGGLWGQAALGLPDFVARAASLGYRAVMLAGKRPHLSPLDFPPDRVAELKAVLDRHGVAVGSSRVDLQACKLEYSIVSPK